MEEEANSLYLLKRKQLLISATATINSRNCYY